MKTFLCTAYKHVPMLEKNPWEAIFNILGSRVIMNLAVKFGVKRFVLVSTDKRWSFASRSPDGQANKGQGRDPARPTATGCSGYSKAKLILQVWQAYHEPTNGKKPNFSCKVVQKGGISSIDQ